MVGQHLARGLGRAGSLEGTGTVGGPCRAVPCRAGRSAGLPAPRHRGCCRPGLAPSAKSRRGSRGDPPQPGAGKGGCAETDEGLPRLLADTGEAFFVFSPLAIKRFLTNEWFTGGAGDGSERRRAGYCWGKPQRGRDIGCNIACPGRRRAGGSQPPGLLFPGRQSPPRVSF